MERDTRSQAKGNNFFQHRARRIGASGSKAACQTNPTLPSQSLIQSICYPELNKLNTEAIRHGCKHEQDAITAYEKAMQEKHVTFKVKKSGLIINEKYPWIHASPDFLCLCDCCGEGCGEVKCPLCVENCDFEGYILKPSSCLKKDSNGSFKLTCKETHQYCYQCQQQIFTSQKLYCDFVVCASNYDGRTELVQQRIFPNADHWTEVAPKLTNFWRTIILFEKQVLSLYNNIGHFRVAFCFCFQILSSIYYTFTM